MYEPLLTQILYDGWRYSTARLEQDRYLNRGTWHLTMGDVPLILPTDLPPQYCGTQNLIVAVEPGKHSFSKHTYISFWLNFATYTTCGIFR